MANYSVNGFCLLGGSRIDLPAGPRTTCMKPKKPINLDSHLLRKEEAVRLEEQYGELLDYLIGPASSRTAKLEMLAEGFLREARASQVRVPRVVPRPTRELVIKDLLKIAVVRSLGWRE